MQQMVAIGGMGMNIGLGMGFPYFQHTNYNAACQQVRNNYQGPSDQSTSMTMSTRRTFQT